MNNSITAMIFITMMLTMGTATAYVFAPSPAIFKMTEGGEEKDNLYSEVGRGGGRGR